MLRCVLEAYALLHPGEDLEDATIMINEAGGEEEMDITDLPIRLQEYIRGIKDAADRQSNDVIR